MSLIAQLLKEKADTKGFLCAVGGQRLAGKSTLAGTLLGKTLLIQPKGIEAGNLSPIHLAKSLGNSLDLIEFGSAEAIFEILLDKSISDYDNIYLDGISAFTELLYNSPIFAAKTKKNKWDGFSYIQDQSTQLVTRAKELAEEQDQNVFITFAIKNKYTPDGQPFGVEMVSKGNATKDLIEGKCPNVIVVYNQQVEGKTEMVRKILTSNNGPYTARLGNMLDSENPRVVDADLSSLLKIAKQL